MGTRSDVMMLAMVIEAPAPRPQSALAKIKLVMLCARAHHRVPSVNKTIPKINGGFLPIVSDNRPARGWKAVEVNKKAVDSHEALFDEWKCDVITGWLDAIIVPSKQTMNIFPINPRNISQN